jgi:hypothetical protein
MIVGFPSLLAVGRVDVSMEEVVVRRKMKDEVR